MKKWWLISLVLSGLLTDASGQQQPMPVNYADEATYRWLGKPVHASRPVDDMEDLEGWSLTGKGELSLSTDPARQGKHSIRFETLAMRADDQPAPNKRNFEQVTIALQIPGEDWSDWNRISFWVYPDLPGWKTVHTRVRLRNEGEIRVPGGFYPVYHLANLKNREWNHVVWELGDLPRDKVTAVEFFRRRQGHEPGASNEMVFYYDQLELQQVDGDYIEGWEVWPGRIAFSHTGYLPGSPKQALASGLPGTEFRLIDQGSGQTAFTGQIKDIETGIGRFRQMDFSDFNQPGTYVIRTGTQTTRPFRICEDVWIPGIEKAINFYYAERCGTEIPGVHRACHGDWLGIHGDRKMVINGGWHDAGDLSQGLINTAEAVYAMFELAESLRNRSRNRNSAEDLQAGGKHLELAERLIEEASWGLEWVLKTHFGDGHRIVWSTMGLWTNGIIGDADDVTSEASNDPMSNFCAAAAEAIAARVLEDRDPDKAARCLSQAIRDWQFGIQGRDQPVRHKTRLEIDAYGAIASMELYKTTGLNKFAEEAIGFAGQIVAAQQREFLEGLDQAITGFFYTGPDQTQILHYIHRSHEQAPILALASLIEAFPGHPDWIDWYATVALHSEFYQKAMARLTAPYMTLPNSLHTPAEAETRGGSRQEDYREQILNGFKVGRDWYVRMYPVQTGGAFRGNYGTMLSQAKAVSTAARIRRNGELGGLARRQLQWVVGLNPFAQSTMYGEGYDYTPQYSAMSGDIVGALPVGIKSRENDDLPYWPVHNYPNYKEVWVHPVTRWFSIMADVYNDSKIRTEGLDFEILGESGTGSANLNIRLDAKGTGKHKFTLRAFNARFREDSQELDLSDREQGTLVWKGKVDNQDMPWIVIVLADGNPEFRKELFGNNR